MTHEEKKLLFMHIPLTFTHKWKHEEETASKSQFDREAKTWVDNGPLRAAAYTAIAAESKILKTFIRLGTSMSTLKGDAMELVFFFSFLSKWWQCMRAASVKWGSVTMARGSGWWRCFCALGMWRELFKLRGPGLGMLNPVSLHISLLVHSLSYFFFFSLKLNPYLIQS